MECVICQIHWKLWLRWKNFITGVKETPSVSSSHCTDLCMLLSSSDQWWVRLSYTRAYIYYSF